MGRSAKIRHRRARRERLAKTLPARLSRFHQQLADAAAAVVRELRIFGGA